MTDTPVKPARPFSSWELGLAFRYLRAKRKEGGVALIAIISFVGIMLAVAVLIAVMSIMNGFRAELMGRILQFNGHMYVQGQVLNGPDRDAMLTRLSDHPQVISVAPLVESPSAITVGGQGAGVVVRGIRPEDLRDMELIADSVGPEAMARFGQGDYGGDEVIIGKALADQLGVRIGDPISLISFAGATSAMGSLGPMDKTYIVGGLFTAGMADYDRAFVFMPLEQAQLFYAKEGMWDVVEVMLADPDQAPVILQEIADTAGPRSIVTDWTTRNAAFWEALQIERIAMRFILMLIVAIAAMNIISGIVMLVKNKGRDIAILRTMGASPRAVMRVFFTAGASIGAAGTLTGVVLGVLFCWQIGPIQRFLEGVTGASLFNSEVYLLPQIPALIDPVEVGWIIFWALLVSCLATLPPAWRASKLDPVEALRYE